MNALKNITVTTALVLSTGVALQAQSNRTYSKSFGNSEAGATVTFNSFYDDGSSSSGFINNLEGGARLTANGTLWGIGLPIVDIGGHAFSHEGNPQLYLPAYRAARAWAYFGGQMVFEESSVVTVEDYEASILPILGKGKKKSLGPFTISVKAGLTATVTRDLEATLDFLNLRADARAGIDASIDASCSGSISAGPVGGCAIVANVELVGANATLVGEITPSSFEASLDLSGRALSILVQLKAWTFIDSWSKTLVNKTYYTWSMRLGFAPPPGATLSF